MERAQLTDTRLAIVIPAYCEETTIGAVAKAASAYGSVIVVDDHSSDATGDRACQAGATVVRPPQNRGYDGALSFGFEAAAEAGFTHIVTLDADGEHDPAIAAKFRTALLDRKVPLVLGVRPRKQRLAEVVMGHIIKARYGVDDILCGMKGYDLALWRANDGFDHADGIGTELAVNALKAGVSFEQIAVGGTPRIDAPRFDRLLNANLRIIRALIRAMRRPVVPALQKIAKTGSKT